MIKNSGKIALLILVIMTAAILRFTGLDWDSGQHLHPDERFLTMVAGSMEWPRSLGEYFNTGKSLLNPHNIGNGFYVYGTYPVILVKFIADSISMDDYSKLTYVGRFMSGLADLLTCLVVFFIGKNLNRKYVGGIVAMSAYALATLPIQLSHFFAVDPYATLFTAISFYLLVKNKYNPLLGISVGLAAAAKISSLIIIPFAGIGFILYFFKLKKPQRIPHVLNGFFILLAFFLTVRIFYPYLFTASLIPTLNPLVLENWKQLESFNDPNSYFPPGVQWITTKPLIFPFLNILYFGMGIPLTVMSVLGLIYGLAIKRSRNAVIIALFILSLFVYQGVQYVKALRYFYTLYPLLAVFAGLIASELWRFKLGRVITLFLLTMAFLWSVAFTSIYRHTNTRVAASEWIYSHIPAGSALAIESWDDGLPVSLDVNRTYGNYKLITLPITGPDNQDKWNQINTMLSQVDYVLLTSNRGYGSMLSVPDRYPTTAVYYRRLFDGSLGFKKVAEFASRPSIPVPGINICITPPGLTYGKNSLIPLVCPDNNFTIVDDYADETWTVYDHPKVLIFQKINYHGLNWPI